jgi:DNA-binding XRE family transcriptional regulator
MESAVSDFFETHPDFKDREFRHCYFADQFRISIAYNLKRIRKEKGLTQQQLAEAAGITQNMIARAEDWDGGMTIDTLIKVFDGLGLVPRLSFEAYSMDAAFPYHPTDTGSVT